MWLGRWGSSLGWSPQRSSSHASRAGSCRAAPLGDTAGLSQGTAPRALPWAVTPGTPGVVARGNSLTPIPSSWSTCQAKQVTLNYRGMLWESYLDLTLPSPPARVPSSTVHSNTKEGVPVLLASCGSGRSNFNSSPSHLFRSQFLFPVFKKEAAALPSKKA